MNRLLKTLIATGLAGLLAACAAAPSDRDIFAADGVHWTEFAWSE